MSAGQTAAQASRRCFRIKSLSGVALSHALFHDCLDVHHVQAAAGSLVDRLESLGANAAVSRKPCVDDVRRGLKVSGGLRIRSRKRGSRGSSGRDDRTLLRDTGQESAARAQRSWGPQRGSLNHGCDGRCVHNDIRAGNLDGSGGYDCGWHIWSGRRWRGPASSCRSRGWS